jgi:hypothetical protein
VLDLEVSDARQVRLDGAMFQAIRGQVCHITAQRILVQGVWIGYSELAAERYIAALGGFVCCAGGRRNAATQEVLNSLVQPGLVQCRDVLSTSFRSS